VSNRDDRWTYRRRESSENRLFVPFPTRPKRLKPIQSSLPAFKKHLSERWPVGDVEIQYRINNPIGVTAAAVAVGIVVIIARPIVKGCSKPFKRMPNGASPNCSRRSARKSIHVAKELDLNALTGPKRTAVDSCSEISVTHRTKRISQRSQLSCGPLQVPCHSPG
jgi:hypothetical protein